MTRRLLIVSPHFPPVNAPDMQRVRQSLPFFIEAGWEVTVLTVDDPTPTAPVEPELNATIPLRVRVVRTACLSRRWTRWFGLGNVALRALPFLFSAGCRILVGKRYDVVYFSTTMFIVLPFGRLWRRLYGVPYVIDLQDPWVTDYYERPGAPPPPGGWKYGVAQAMARGLEHWTMRRVSHLITVSSAYADSLRSRYPELVALPATELPFGAPETDLGHLRATLADRAPLLPRTGLALAFAGALGPGMLGPVEVLFAAVARLRREGVPVSVHFFGTSYSPGGEAKAVTRAIAVRYGLEECVHEEPARIPYLTALQVTLEARVNLLLGSSDFAFTPSKILAVQAAGRPVLALAYRGSAMATRLAQLGLSSVHLDGAGDNAEAAAATAASLRVMLLAGTRPPSLSAAYSARALAERQLEIFTAVAAGRT